MQTHTPEGVVIMCKLTPKEVVTNCKLTLKEVVMMCNLKNIVFPANRSNIPGLFLNDLFLKLLATHN